VRLLRRFSRDESGQVLMMIPPIMFLGLLILSMIITAGQQEYLRTKAQVIADSAALAVAAQSPPVQGAVWLDPNNERPRFPDDYEAVYDPKTGQLEGYRLDVPLHEYYAFAGYETTADWSEAQAMADANESGSGGKLVRAEQVNINTVLPKGTTPLAQDVLNTLKSFIPWQNTSQAPPPGPEEDQPIQVDLTNLNPPGSSYGPDEVWVGVTVSDPSIFDWFYTFLGNAKDKILSATMGAQAYAKKSPADLQYESQVNFADLNQQGYSQ